VLLDLQGGKEFDAEGAAQLPPDLLARLPSAQQ